MQRIALCITGASGVIYGFRLLEALTELGYFVDLVVSSNARIVLKEEHGKDLSEALKNIKNYELHGEKDLLSPLASGSRLVRYKGVYIVPCSTSTLACISNGVNQNLIHRIGETALKERVPLILLVREMPYSRIHLENMLKLTEAGAIVMPASPAFYHKPKSIEDMVNFVVGKLLDTLRIEHNLFKRWKE